MSDFTDKYKAMPDRILVPNVGESLLLWEVGRLRTLFEPIRKTRDDIRARFGTGALAHVHDKQMHDVRTFLREHCGAWVEHRARCHRADQEFRQIDRKFPLQLDDIQDYLDRYVIDVEDIRNDTLSRRHAAALNYAAYAGVHKAEIAVDAAYHALQVLGDDPAKSFLDLATQVELMVRDGLARRERAADPVRRQVVNDGCAGSVDQVELRTACVYERGLPFCVWLPKLVVEG